MTAERREGDGRRDPQSRILVLAMLAEAGPKGVSSDDLKAALLGIGMTINGAATRLQRDKRFGLIFGRGEYVLGGGIGLTYRYFATQQWCDEYVFEPAQTVDEIERRRHEREKARWVKRKAEQTPEDLAIRRQKVRERTQARRLAAQVDAGGLPTRERVRLCDMTPDEFRAYNRAYRKSLRDAERAARIAAGQVVRTRAPNGQGKKRLKAAAPKAARPGSELIVVRNDVNAPVQVPRRPVLVGEPVITSATKVTIARVQRDYRFWVDPATVRPTFGALRVGEYLDEREVCDAV